MSCCCWCIYLPTWFPRSSPTIWWNGGLFVDILRSQLLIFHFGGNYYHLNGNFLVSKLLSNWSHPDGVVFFISERSWVLMLFIDWINGNSSKAAKTFLFISPINWGNQTNTNTPPVPISVDSLTYTFRVRTGHGKPGKSWNLIISFSRPGKSWNLGLGHGKSWKIRTLSMSERQ